MSRFPVKLQFNARARRKLLKGMNIVADAVGTTLGPKGRNVAINNPTTAPSVIHDGVSVAKRIDLEDAFEDMGAQLLKEAALQTSKKAGDGTTTSTILAQAIVTKGFENVTAGYNAMTLKAEIDEAKQLVFDGMKKLVQPIETLEDITKVATISAADPVIGKLVAEAVHKVGPDGLVTIEESQGTETYVEYKNGFEFNQGYFSSSFVTNRETAEAVVTDPYILITDIKINHDYQVVPFLESLVKRNIKNLVIIGEVQEQALTILALNKLNGTFNAVAVQAPGYGNRQLEELEDIAVLTGGTVIQASSGRELKSVVPEELGRANKFIADAEKSKIIGGGGSDVAVKGRIKEITSSVKNASTPYDKELRKQRLARMSGQAAVIYVGAHSDPELSDRKERIDDAVNASRAAVEEGIVAGGEITLLYLSLSLEWPTTIGANILREAIKAPFKKLISNAGLEYAEVWGAISPFKYPFGIDVMDGKKKNLIESGIIDPVKVTRLALEHAVSVSTMCLTTDVLISEPYKPIESK